MTWVCVGFVCVMTSTWISQQVITGKVWKIVLGHFWHISAVLPVKATSFRLAVKATTILSSALLTLKIELTGKIIQAQQSTSLCWKNTLLIVFGIKFNLHIMGDYLPNHHWVYRGVQCFPQNQIIRVSLRIQRR